MKKNVDAEEMDLRNDKDVLNAKKWLPKVVLLLMMIKLLPTLKVISLQLS